MFVCPYLLHWISLFLSQNHLNLHLKIYWTENTLCWDVDCIWCGFAGHETLPSIHSKLCVATLTKSQNDLLCMHLWFILSLFVWVILVFGRLELLCQSYWMKWYQELNWRMQKANKFIKPTNNFTCTLAKEKDCIFIFSILPVWSELSCQRCW